MSLKDTITKLRLILQSKLVKTIFLVVLLILIADTLVALVAVSSMSYSSEIVWSFWMKPPNVILSDFLFLEGALFFTIGAFIAVARPSRETPTERTVDAVLSIGQTVKKNLGKFAIVIGIILIVLSIIIGSLPR